MVVVVVVEGERRGEREKRERKERERKRREERGGEKRVAYYWYLDFAHS